MKGKALFAAMNLVDERFVQEAEDATLSAGRVLSFPKLRWAAALAACVCLLLGWAVAARMTKLSASSENTAEAGMESSAEMAAEGNDTGPEENFSTEAADVAEGTAEQPAETGQTEGTTLEDTSPAEEDKTALVGGAGSALLPVDDVQSLRARSGPETEEWLEFDPEISGKAAMLLNALSPEADEETPDEAEIAPITLEFTMHDGSMRTFRLLDATPADGGERQMFLAEENGGWHRVEQHAAIKLMNLLGYAIVEPAGE